MISSLGLFLLIMLYLALLFFIAFWAEKKRSNFWVNNPYIYSLSLAVYCTAWTYYGSIGVAAKQGLEYMAIYIGPVIIIPAWIIINTKIIKISRVNKISSIADFISLRYGNRRSLGALISFVCILAIVPYIGLQIKAISETFHLMTGSENSSNIIKDTATYVVLLIAIFSSYYGTRYVDASEKRPGIISAVAVESFLKLLFFVILGIFVLYGVFNGFEDIYTQASKLEDFSKKNTFAGLEGTLNWIFMCLLSMSAIFMLPRQFHNTIIENRKEKHIKTAIWLFPLYLLIFNFFVFPVAWGGNILFKGLHVNPELYSILIPQKFGNYFISILVFLGGLSASVSMIIISSISLSIMLSNNVIIPYGWLEKFKKDNNEDNSKSIVSIRKISILILILLAFIFYKYFIVQSSLFSVGLVSFVLIAQLAPAFFGAIIWRRGTYLGVVTGIIAGVTICYITLILPQYYQAFRSGFSMEEFKTGVEVPIKILTFFKIPYLSPISQVFFWSILINFILYIVISASSKGDYRERNFAEIYVDIEKYIENHENAFIWKGIANRSDIQKILVKFLGEKKTKQALNIFDLKYDIKNDNDKADARFIKFSENLLSGRIGTASAKILVEGVVKEDCITLPEVLSILEESQQNISLNKKLTDLSGKLKNANNNLIVKDKQKDDFLDAVAHELRTPITAIKAAGEILQEDIAEMPEEVRNQFLDNIISESDRLNEIINDLLYLDKLENTETILNIEDKSIIETLKKTTQPLLHILEKKNLRLTIDSSLKQEQFIYDEKRIIQVLNNLLGNAIKFTDENGIINILISDDSENLFFTIFNTGRNIPEDELVLIFEKFYQSKNQNIRKPIGSGLGLSICKKIIEAHGGKIYAENINGGVQFKFNLPKNTH